MSRTVYDSSHTYDLEAALTAALEKVTERQNQARKSAWLSQKKTRSGGSAVDPSFEAYKAADRLYWLQLDPPTEDALNLHARRFGSEGVAEIAEVYGLAVAATLAEREKPKRRHTSTGMREKVTALHKRGLVPAAIADALNISDSRVKRLLRSDPVAA